MHARGGLGLQHARVLHLVSRLCVRFHFSAVPLPEARTRITEYLHELDGELFVYCRALEDSLHERQRDGASGADLPRLSRHCWELGDLRRRLPELVAAFAASATVPPDAAAGLWEDGRTLLQRLREALAYSKALLLTEPDMM